MATPNDDFTASPERSGRLAVGSFATGQLEAGGDEDWFAIDLEAGKTYSFALQGAPNNAGTLPWAAGAQSLRLYGPGLDVLDSSVLSTPGFPALSFTPRTSGTYYLDVRNAAAGGTGSYTVSAASAAPDDVGDTAGTATRLLPGQSFKGVIGTSSDLDVFRVGIVQGHVYKLTQPGGGLPVVLGGGKASADGSVIFRAPYTGDLTVLVAGPEGRTGGYTLQFDETEPDDVGSTLATAATLTPGTTFKGQLGVADSDWLQLPSSGGEAYLINVKADVVPHLTVTSASTGTPLANGGIYVADGQPNFLVLDGPQPGAYEVSATLLADDYRNTATSAVRVLKTAQGKIDYSGDTDYFSIDVRAGEVYALALIGQGGTMSAKLAANGTLIGSAPSGTGPGTLVFQAQADGAAVIAVTGTPTQTEKLPAYTLTRVSTIDDAANSIAMATAIPVDTVINAAINVTGDLDVYKVVLQAGISYTLDASASVVALLGAGHAPLTQLKAGQWFTPSTTQEYSVVVASPGTGSYQLAVRTAASDDLPASSATSAHLAEAAPVTVTSQQGDRDWVAVDLAAGVHYQVTSSGTGTLVLRDAAGHAVAPSYTSTAGSRFLDFTPEAAGTWYVEVADGSGAARLALNRLAADDFDGSLAHAALARPGQMLTARLDSASDADAVRMHLDAGHWYGVRMTDLGKLGDIPFSSAMMDVYQVAADGSYVPVQIPANGEFEAAAGDYVFAVHRAPNWASSGVMMLVQDMGADDQPSTTAPTALAAGASVTATAQAAGDTDSYTVALESGQVYTLSLTGANGASLGPGQGSIDIQLGTQRGTAVLGQGLTFVAPSTGDFVVNTHFATAGTYTLNMRTAGADTEAPVLQPAAPDAVLQLGQSIDLEFNEAILASGGEITLRAANGAVLQQFNGGTRAYTIHDNHLVLDPGIVLVPGETYTLNLALGAVTDLAGNPALVADPLTITIAPPATAPTDGDDLLVGTGVSGTLDGGAGRDTVYLPEALGGYAIQVGTGGTVKVTAATHEGQVFTHIERMVFANDGSALAFDTAGNGGQAYRLYQAAFDRAPDKSGLGYWINALDHGASLAAVADSFIQSPEFRGLYGTETTDTQFVNALYQNVLHRLPDASGAQYWLDALANGLPRAHVLFYFSESTENVANVAPVIGHGFEYVPFL